MRVLPSAILALLSGASSILPSHAHVNGERRLDDDGSYSEDDSTSSKSSKSSSSSSKSSKSADKCCTLDDLAGKFKLDYDFYSSSDGAYTQTSAALTFEPVAGGKGVMNVGFCFGFGPKQMVAVQTGFAKDCTIPIKIVKYEDDQEDIYDDYSFSGEYNCASETLMVGFAGYFDGNAFTADPSVKDDTLVLDGDGCIPEVATFRTTQSASRD